MSHLKVNILLSSSYIEDGGSGFLRNLDKFEFKIYRCVLRYERNT